MMQLQALEFRKKKNPPLTILRKGLGQTDGDLSLIPSTLSGLLPNGITFIKGAPINLSV